MNGDRPDPMLLDLRQACPFRRLQNRRTGTRRPRKLLPHQGGVTEGIETDRNLNLESKLSSSLVSVRFRPMNIAGTTPGYAQGLKRGVQEKSEILPPSVQALVCGARLLCTLRREQWVRHTPRVLHRRWVGRI